MKPLSPRECQVVELFVQGWTRKEIAFKLGITTMTVYSTLHNAKEKTGCRTVMSAIVYLVTHGNVMINSA
jgi:DNA-binding NarL/FixJ family response regulator